MKIIRPTSNQPMPEDAKLVFKGVIFDVYQWQQKMFDGSIQTFEKLKRADTVVVIPVTTTGKIVLTLEEQPGKKPFTSVLGGRVEEGEDVLDAAKRELLEETGMVAKEIVLWNAIQPISKIDWAVYTFIAKGCESKNDLRLDAGEKISLKFLDFDQFAQAVLADSFNEEQITLSFLKARMDSKDMEKIRQMLIS